MWAKSKQKVTVNSCGGFPPPPFISCLSWSSLLLCVPVSQRPQSGRAWDAPSCVRATWRSRLGEVGSLVAGNQLGLLFKAALSLPRCGDFVTGLCRRSH